MKTLFGGSLKVALTSKKQESDDKKDCVHAVGTSNLGHWKICKKDKMKLKSTLELKRQLQWGLLVTQAHWVYVSVGQSAHHIYWIDHQVIRY